MSNVKKQIPYIVFWVIATAVVSIGLYSAGFPQIGYRVDAGVLDEGRLIDYHNYQAKLNSASLAIIDGELRRVNTWKISYVDKNGKFGACKYYTPSGSGSPKYNSKVKCDRQELQFN